MKSFSLFAIFVVFCLCVAEVCEQRESILVCEGLKKDESLVVFNGSRSVVEYANLDGKSGEHAMNKREIPI